MPGGGMRRLPSAATCQRHFRHDEIGLLTFALEAIPVRQHEIFGANLQDGAVGQ